ncbi:hypothetical protein [Embleya sp. NPDC020630]|uniref:hypothetical protein n=1 Tax=Embleya sp. NPDC020630 TaxID=3363979 RepID=UPI0037BCC13C
MTATTDHRPPTPTVDPEAIEAAVRPVYRERAEYVADLAARWPSVLVHPAPDLPAYALLHIHTAAGPITRHIHHDDLDLVAHVRRVGPDDPRAAWDGHTTAEGYNRLRALRPDLWNAPPRVVGARVVYRDGHGDLWITSPTDPDRIHALTPEYAPTRWTTPAGILHATGTLTALGGAR